ncbi:MAG: hypothetical protein UR60_C0010G0017 [Candidatus Moranbacteria bacterium GW2011_GWF2_34_56]|nr:MAG: hypothetical protein UR60_C0010G0017 [Candidatus Moranbacteria bacterium GW2011_GWF2_34_56]
MPKSLMKCAKAKSLFWGLKLVAQNLILDPLFIIWNTYPVLFSGFFIPILSTISIYLFYLLFKKIFPTSISLILTFLCAISFYALKYAHFAWNPNVIPFFVFSFLLLLNKIIHYSYQDAINRASTYRDFIFLGVIIGIGIQLHTTLLILMPLFTFLTLAYLYLKKGKINFKKILVLFCIIIFLNLPFIYEAANNGGKNIQDFIAGTQTKTESKLSILKNISNTAQFFLQGSAYHLSGIEPQKNWLNIIKLFKSKNVAEITLFLSSLLIFLSGVYLIFKKNKLTKSKNTLYLLISFVTLSFLLLIPVGNELNIRFFIIIQFLPYLLLGFIIQVLLNSSLKKVYLVPITFFILLVSFFNLLNYYKTYNLDSYTTSESSYGGISLGELNEVCEHIKKISQESNLEKIYIENFKFKRSLEYICNKEDIRSIFLSQDKIKDQEIFFVIIENKNLDKNIEKYKENFELKNSIKIKRFVLLNFNNK